MEKNNKLMTSKKIVIVISSLLALIALIAFSANTISSETVLYESCMSENREIVTIESNDAFVSGLSNSWGRQFEFDLTNNKDGIDNGYTIMNPPGGQDDEPPTGEVSP